MNQNSRSGRHGMIKDAAQQNAGARSFLGNRFPSMGGKPDANAKTRRYANEPQQQDAYSSDEDDFSFSRVVPRHTQTEFPWWLVIVAAVLLVLFIVLGVTMFGGKGDTGTSKNSTGNTALDAKVAETLSNMTTEQKVAQLFIISPEQLTGVETATMAGDATATALQSYPVGGITYSSSNIESSDQLSSMISTTQSYSTIPLFICIGEEGGSSASPIANSGVISVTFVDDAATIGATGDATNAYNAASTIGTYLSQLGFNVDFAPDCDVVTDTANAAIGIRSFGGDATVVSQMVASEVKGLQTAGVHATLKHFPGFGDVANPTDGGIASSNRTLDQLNSIDLLPFKAGIDAGAQMVMVSNVAYPQITGNSDPACYSSTIITDILRTQLGFNGIVVSDSQNSSAITAIKSSGDGAVAFIQAGGDMILMPADFTAAYNAVLTAVQNGTISEERLNDSVTRILQVKLASS